MDHKRTPVSWPSVAVVLPGTGSDADFVARAFGPALSEINVAVQAVDPDPNDIVGSYLDALDAAARRFDSILTGGVSIGAAVAVEWCLSHREQSFGVLAALPAWTGTGTVAPAAQSARCTAGQLRADGLEAVIAQMRESSPPWLAEELARSWRSQWPALPAAMDQAARYHAPTLADLTHMRTPVGIAAATDDPIHPLAVALEWRQALPHADLRTLSLDRIGADPAILGRTSLLALGRALQAERTWQRQWRRR